MYICIYIYIYICTYKLLIILYPIRIFACSLCGARGGTGTMHSGMTPSCLGLTP